MHAGLIFIINFLVAMSVKVYEISEYETDLKRSTACIRLAGASNGNTAGRKYDTVLNDVNVSPDGGQNQTFRDVYTDVSNRPGLRQVNVAAHAWFCGLSCVHATS